MMLRLLLPNLLCSFRHRPQTFDLPRELDFSKCQPDSNCCFQGQRSSNGSPADCHASSTVGSHDFVQAAMDRVAPKNLLMLLLLLLLFLIIYKLYWHMAASVSAKGADPKHFKPNSDCHCLGKQTSSNHSLADSLSSARLAAKIQSRHNLDNNAPQWTAPADACPFREH